MYYLKPGILDQIRKTHNISSWEKLAAKINVTRGTIDNIRAERVSPSLETMMKIAALAGRPIDSMLIEKDDTAA